MQLCARFDQLLPAGAKSAATFGGNVKAGKEFASRAVNRWTQSGGSGLINFHLYTNVGCGGPPGLPAVHCVFGHKNLRAAAKPSCALGGKGYVPLRECPAQTDRYPPAKSRLNSF
jgi:hypothetical protein